MRLAGAPAGKETHGCRVSSHTAMVGGGNAGSAKLPIATTKYSGKLSLSQKTVEPHDGQKRNVTWLPLSAMRDHEVASPATAI